MNSQDLKDLIDYIMEHNSWKNCSAFMENRKMPKYLDFKLWFTLDTRDGIISYLKTRQSGKDKSFRIETKEDLKKLYLGKMGGTSLFAPVLAFCALDIITSIISRL